MRKSKFKDKMRALLFTSLDCEKIDIIKLISCQVEFTKEDYNSFLMKASRISLDIVKYFVDKGADVNSISNLPLIRSASAGKFDIFKYLIDKGANIRIGSVLTAACDRGNINIVKYILENGGNVHEEHYGEIDAPLISSASNGHLDVVKYLSKYTDYIDKSKKMLC